MIEIHLYFYKIYSLIHDAVILNNKFDKSECDI